MRSQRESQTRREASRSECEIQIVEEDHMYCVRASHYEGDFKFTDYATRGG